MKAHPPSFTWHFYQRRILALALLLLPLLNACGESTKDYTQAKYTVDKALFAKGRPCTEVLFKCLPESQDKAWQQIDPNDKRLIENRQFSEKEYNAAKQRVIEAENKMLITDDMMKGFEEMAHSRFIENQVKSLEKQFPGFWRDVPKPVRIRWVKRAITKANKYGYNGEVTDAIQVIELCARIGLDFDLDPKWEAITKFISHPSRGLLSYASMAVEYIDFTIYKKDIDRHGYNITDWSLRTALQHLPYPKRKLPSIND